MSNDKTKEKYIRIKGEDNIVKKYKIIDQYMYCETADYIDKGSFGQVYRGYPVPGNDQNDKPLAIKI
jgi:serine/threonine protein kinase